MPDAADGRFGAVASRLRRWRTGRSGSGAALGPYIRPYRSRSGDLVERLTSDVGRLQDLLVAVFERLLPRLLAIVGMLLVLFAVDVELGLAALAVVPFLGYLAVVSQRRINRAERRTRT